MAQKKRWGKPFEDKRDHGAYSERLVKRGEYWLDIDFVKSWGAELAEMNKNKVGRPYGFPESLIKLQAHWRAKGATFRDIEGTTRRIAKIANLPDYNHYSTACRRINKLSLTLQKPRGDNLTVFADGSSHQIVEGGEYMREKYGKKNRRWAQVIIWGDPEGKEPVSIEVNLVQESELASAKKQLQKLVDDGVPIAAAGGDGAFDEIDFWNWLDDRNIVPLLKPDRNARDDTDSEVRNLAVKYRNEHGYDTWRHKTGYGHRWPATEGIFSAVKRIFGEQLHSRREKGLLQEAELKYWAYQRLKRYGEA